MSHYRLFSTCENNRKRDMTNRKWDMPHPKWDTADRN